MLRGMARGWVAGVLVAITASCSLVVTSEVRSKGVGALCVASDECQAGFCDNGLCTATCTSSSDCPTGTSCFGGKCQKPLQVGALWVGVVSGGEGWTLTHQEGMQDVGSRLPYLKWDYRENVLPFTGDVAKTVDELVGKGAQVIIANSYSLRDEVLKKADQYPEVKFVTCSSYKSNGRNATSYAAHGEQSWFVAGKVAASKLGPKKRLGYVGSFITPEVVRHISAFYLGAKSLVPDVKLEVQWLGFWYDYKPQPSYVYKGPITNGVEERVFREELLTYRLMEAGAEVIGHGGDNQRVARLVERLTKAGKIQNVWTFSNDNRNGFREITADNLPNGPPLQTCLGSPYWNWGPMYARMFEDIHRGTWDSKEELNDAMSAGTESIIGFNLNPSVGIDDSSVRTYVNDMARAGWEAVYYGPYATTGQRDKNGDGIPDSVQTVEANEKMSEDEYKRMCWFPKGIVERANPADVTSAEVDARVPDKARVADPKFLDDIEGPPDAPAGVGIDCNENR